MPEGEGVGAAGSRSSSLGRRRWLGSAWVAGLLGTSLPPPISAKPPTGQLHSETQFSL